MKKYIILILILLVFVGLNATNYSKIDGAILMYNYFIDFIADSSLGTNNYSRVDGQVKFQNDFITFLEWADTTGKSESPFDTLYIELEVGQYNYTDATKLTIADGAVTITQSAHTIDGESGDADDLKTINGGENGDYLIIYPNNAARNITLVDTGNILTSNDVDYTIPDNGMVILYNNGTKWLAFTGGSTFPMPNNNWATWENNAGDGNVNAIKVNASDELDFGAVLNTGSIEFETDSGVITAMNLPVGATPADEAEEGYAFSVDSNPIVQILASANSAGGVYGERLKIDGSLFLNDAQTFGDGDHTPNVIGYTNFETNTNAATITDFDWGGKTIPEGQLLVVFSKGAITYDVTFQGIKGGSTDIITAAGDLTTFLYDGTDWIVISRMDISDNLN